MSYQDFIDALQQTEQDQSFYENATQGGDLQGKSDTALVRLGGQMLQKMRIFADIGPDFAAKMPSDFCVTLRDTLADYGELMMPPKVCGGLCPCLKSLFNKRDGPEYTRRYLLVRMKVTAAIFATQAVVIDEKAEVINIDSMHFADYSNKCNAVMKALEIIKSNNPGEQAREKAKKELISATEQVAKFLKMFDVDVGDLMGEAQRRVNQANELLSTRNGGGGGGGGGANNAAGGANGGGAVPIQKRSLVKVQSSLQEVMNSMAGISSKKARDSIQSLARLAEDLAAIRDAQVKGFEKLKDKAPEYGLQDAVNQITSTTDTIYGDANQKIRDATKRWVGIETLSKPKKVIEYQEDIIAAATLPGGIAVPDDPTKMLENAGKKMGDMGKKGVVGIDKALSKIADKVQGGLDKVIDIGNAAGNGGKKVVNGGGGGGGGAGNAGRGTGGKSPRPANGGASSSAAMKNPFI